MLKAPYRHFLDISDLSAVDLRTILDDVQARKIARKPVPKAQADQTAPLCDHILAMIFDKPSTRTRLSFDLAMRQLGGQTITLNASDIQLGRGETIADTARIVSRFADAAMLRTGAHERIVEFADAASIPVINGLTAFSHPCQIVADLATFEAYKGRLEGQKIAWFGDGNNMAVSFIHAAALLGFELHLAVPDEFRPAQAVLDRAQAQGAEIIVGSDAKTAARGAQALATDCWVSMSDDPRTAERRAKAFVPFQVDQALMDLGDDPIFMHCLPAYRGKEVAADVIDGARSVVLDEAENRIYAQKSILAYCFGHIC